MKSVPEFRFSKPGIYEIVLFPARSDSGENMGNQHVIADQGTWDCVGQGCPLCFSNMRLVETHILYGEVSDNEDQLRKIHVGSALFRELWSKSLLPQRRNGKVIPYDPKGWVAAQVTFKNGEYEVKPSSFQPSQRAYQAWQQSGFLHVGLRPFAPSDLVNSSSDFKISLAHNCKHTEILNTLSEDANPKVRATCLTNKSFKNHSKLMHDSESLVRERCASETSVIEVLEFMSNDPTPKVRARVASNSCISKDLMNKLKRDPEREVLVGLAWNKELSRDLIEYFCFNQDQRLRENISKSSEKISDDSLRKMIADSSVDVLKAIIDRQPVSDEAMKLLTTSNYPEIRCLIAASARSEFVLESLYKDQDPRVFYFLTLNPNADSRKLDAVNPKPSIGEIDAKIQKYRKYDPHGHCFSMRCIISDLFIN